MGINFDPSLNRWVAFASRRHPISRIPISLRRQTTSQKDAIQMERKLRRELDERMLNESSPSWNRVVSEYLDEMRLSSPNEHRSYDIEVTLRKHTFQWWAKRRIKDITTRDVWVLMKLTQVTSLSQGRQKNILKFLRGVFQFALLKGYVQKDPTPKISFKTKNRKRGGLNEEQASLLINRARELSHPWYPIWATALYTGMRNGELFALKWDDINFERRLISVSRSWNWKNGFKGTKSDKERKVPIAGELLKLLYRLKAEQSDNEFVLPRIDGWQSGRQSHELNKFLSHIGLPPMRFHDLRASWTTLLLVKGIEAAKIMKVAGWKELETMDVYIRDSGIEVDGITDVLNFAPNQDN